jgi:hypothetical protein
MVCTEDMFDPYCLFQEFGHCPFILPDCRLAGFLNEIRNKNLLDGKIQHDTSNLLPSSPNQFNMRSINRRLGFGGW